MHEFCTDHLADLAEESGLVFPRVVLAELVAALNAGKHVILTGPPGTGKTSLAFLAADLARHAVLCSGYLAVTASGDWDTSHTIGQYADTPGEGLVFQPGVFLQAIETGQWLVVDELNRADFDKVFGPMFTVLANQSVILPFKRPGFEMPISLVPAGGEAPPHTDALRIPAPWRMVATMNVFDKDLLYRLSYALMRRFAFIEVQSPSEEQIIGLLDRTGDRVVRELLAVRRFVDLGPAVFLDAARYGAIRLEDPDATPSRVRFEAFYSYLLPQLDQLGDREAAELFDALAPVFDPPELHELRRVIRTVLGATGQRSPVSDRLPQAPTHVDLAALS